jgi:hypothetical protein
MRHIRDAELDRYLDRHNLDLELHMVSKPEKPKTIYCYVKITSRLTESIVVDQTFEGIPLDEDIMNMIKPIIRDKILNSFC